VSVVLRLSTRVAGVVSGTTTDLTSNARVELHLVNGTTVDAVRVDLVTRTAQPPHTSTGAHVHGTKPAGKVGHVHPARPNPTPRVPTRVAGQVVSVNGSSITIRTPRGTSTYTLAGNVSVVLIMNGTSSDLALGETVQSVVNSSNAALEITILKA
jgi:FtsP/CotA-like multicopper oxidase with cupredoxin domain